MPERRTIEFWGEVRGLVEKGLSLKKASQEFGISYSNLSQRAAKEGWKLCYSGRPRRKDYWDGRQREQIAMGEVERERMEAQIRRKVEEVRGQEAKRGAEIEEARAMLKREAEEVVIDVKKCELMTQKVLRQHSARMKVTFSELVVQTAEDLRSEMVKPKDRALALASLRGVCDRLYGWDKEPDIGALERARSGAINLELIRLSPEQLERRAKAKEALEAQRTSTIVTGHNGQVDGTLSRQREQPPAVGDGQTPMKKEDPQPAKEKPGPKSNLSNPHSPTAVKTNAAPSGEHPNVNIAFGSPSLSPEQRWKHQLEERARLRAEWRGHKAL